MHIPSTPEEIQGDGPEVHRVAWTLLGLLLFIASCVYFFPGG